MLYDVPSTFSGTSFGTLGHIALGTNEKATPSSTIIRAATHGVLTMGRASTT